MKHIVLLGKSTATMSARKAPPLMFFGLSENRFASGFGDRWNLRGGRRRARATRAGPRGRALQGEAQHDSLPGVVARRRRRAGADLVAPVGLGRALDVERLERLVQQRRPAAAAVEDEADAALEEDVVLVVLLDPGLGRLEGADGDAAALLDELPRSPVEERLAPERGLVVELEEDELVLLRRVHDEGRALLDDVGELALAPRLAALEEGRAGLAGTAGPGAGRVVRAVHGLERVDQRLAQARVVAREVRHRRCASAGSASSRGSAARGCPIVKRVLEVVFEVVVHTKARHGGDFIGGHVRHKKPAL